MATNPAMCSPHPLHPADRSVGSERLQDLLAVLGGIDLVVLQQDLAVRSDNKSPALRRDVANERFLLARSEERRVGKGCGWQWWAHRAGRECIGWRQSWRW